jgi:hypothetical protein
MRYMRASHFLIKTMTSFDGPSLALSDGNLANSELLTVITNDLRT